MFKKPIIPIKKASEETIKALINAGYLYVDENGIHAVEQKKEGVKEQWLWKITRLY